MADIFDELLGALNNLGGAIETVTNEKRDFVDIWGGTTPVLTKDEIAERVYDLARRIESLTPDQRIDPYVKWLKDAPTKVAKFQAQIVPNLPGGNAAIVSSLLEQMIAWIEGRLPPQNWPIEWQEAADAGQMPKKLAAKLRGLEATLGALEPRAGDLEGKIKRIEDATEAAESLPTDLETLEEARAKVGATSAEIDALVAKAAESSSTIERFLAVTKTHSDEATKLMGNIDSAYRASTSKALADAFAKRSFWLQVQTWIFVILLIFALSSGAWLGYHRVFEFQKMMESGREITMPILWSNIVLSFLTVAAPVWFAWIATKQITQRFKLAEDYGFKAAVAKAYEGYRREAASVDPLFVTRLFGSALARLEEAPLRLMDAENYGSPFHEITASPAFREALGIVPALRDTYASILGAIAKRTKPGASEAASTVVARANADDVADT